MTDLLPGTSSKKNKKKEAKEWKWTYKEQEVFNNLKVILTNPPILAYPDFTKAFELHTDASCSGLGAVLYQDGHVISFASRSLNKSERNYSAFKLEFLALKWAITEKFKDYLAINHFTVFTDNNPLTYIFTSAKLDATGHRWASALSGFNFDLKYRAGSKNTDADAMSRLPYLDKQQPESKGDNTYLTIDESTVKSICGANTYLPYIDTIPTCSINIVEVTEDSGVPLAQIEYREIRRQQRADPLIERWRRTVIDQYLPDKHQCTSKEDLYMRKHFDSFKIVRSILYRVLDTEAGKTYQLVLPRCYHQQVLSGLHNDIGHPGRERTLSLLRENTFGLVWQKMLMIGCLDVTDVYVGSLQPTSEVS